CRHHALRRKRDDDFGADAQLRLERECPAMQVDQALGDGQTETGALFSRLDRVGALPERGQYHRDFLLGNPRPGVLYAHVLAAGDRPAHLEPYLTPLWREFDRVRQEIDADLQ